jgi:hypothetical protein
MIKLKAILTSLLIICSISHSISQQQFFVENKIELSDYKGTEKKGVFENNGKEVLNGKYVFNSELQKTIENDQIHLKELKIIGNYLSDKKDGLWKFNLNSYFLEDVSIVRSWNLRLNHDLNGTEDEITIPFRNNSFHGKSEWKQKSITNGRIGNAKQLVSVEHNNDTIVGGFVFNTNNVSIKGQCISNGYLDGIIELTYLLNEETIVEKRKYNNGFLLELEKINLTRNEPVVKIVFDDVIEQINLHHLNNEDLGYIISDKYFGLKFNFGYQQDDIRITEQLYGNNLILNHFSLLDSVNKLHNQFANQQTILKFTRRFQFVYEKEEDSLMTVLLPYVANLKNVVEGYSNKPNLVLRKKNSDSLFLQSEVLNHISKKIEIIEEVLAKISTGYFDFRYRYKYYENGVPGLNVVDTIKYSHNNVFKEIPFHVGYLIESPDELLLNLLKYTSLLKSETERSIARIRTSLTVYDNQDKIDSLDKIIAKSEDVIADLYSELDRFSVEEPMKIPFSYKMFISLNERSVNVLKESYLNNSLLQEEMIQIGSDLECYYNFLIENKRFLDEIGGMKSHWNDSLFTIYRDNPFDVRRLETKILEGVQNSANILLTYYANQLLNVKTCEQLTREIQKIIKLNKRIVFLVENYEMENIQQLNRAIRRERVPNRIERILEL